MQADLQETIRIILPVVVAHVLVLGAIMFIMKRMLVGDTVRAVNKIGDAESEIRLKEESMRNELEQHKQEFASKRASAEEDLQERREELEKEMTQVREQTIEKAKREAAARADGGRRPHIAR